jgi:heme-degrading monooxygenase HmoA
MAWARIGVYKLGGDQGGIGRDEAIRLTRESAVPLVRGLPGFIDYELVEAGDTFLAISHWRTQEEATAVTVAHEEWRQATAPALPQPVAVHVGEVVIPRHEA